MLCEKAKKAHLKQIQMLVAFKFNINRGQFNKDISKLGYFKKCKLLFNLVLKIMFLVPL